MKSSAFRLKFLTILFLTVLSACGSSTESGGDYDLNDQLNSDEQSFLKIINQFRADQGLGKLQIEAHLQAASRHHSRYMNHNDTLDHEESGSDEYYYNRISKAGTSFDESAENIAWGNTSAQATFDQWYNSPGHLRNMMDANFQNIGIAREGIYWTTDFGGNN